MNKYYAMINAARKKFLKLQLKKQLEIEKLFKEFSEGLETKKIDTKRHFEVEAYRKYI